MTFNEWHERVWQRAFTILKEHMCEKEAEFLAMEIAAVIKDAREGQFDEEEQ